MTRRLRELTKDGTYEPFVTNTDSNQSGRLHENANEAQMYSRIKQNRVSLGVTRRMRPPLPTCRLAAGSTSIRPANHRSVCCGPKPA
jgi:hypothetical protein